MLLSVSVPLAASDRGMRCTSILPQKDGGVRFAGVPHLAGLAYDRVMTAPGAPATWDPISRALDHLAAWLQGIGGKGNSIRAGLVSTAVVCALAVTSADTAEGTNRVVIEGTVERGHEFAQDFGSGFTFRLRGRVVWAITITHAAAPDEDLIYPVNPPYRFSNRQYVGPGYGESARDSVRNTPRELAFIYRADDIGRAWDDLDRVLWPYTYAEAEVERATNELARFPTGTVTFEVLSAEVGPDEDRPGADGREERVRALKFRVTITWPGT
jgi:hypothetical protein